MASERPYSFDGFGRNEANQLRAVQGKTLEFLLAASERSKLLRRKFPGLSIREVLLGNGNDNIVADIADVTPASLVGKLERFTDVNTIAQVLKIAKSLAINGDPTKNPQEVALLKALIDDRKTRQKYTPGKFFQNLRRGITPRIAFSSSKE